MDQHYRNTEVHMLLRSFWLLLVFAILLLNGNALYASCDGCCHGDSLITNATASSTAARLPGIPGAAGTPALATVPGAPGLAGAPGTIGLPSGVLDYAYMYSSSASTTIAVLAGGDISFNIPAATPVNPLYFPPGTSFSHPAASILKIFSPGTFIARYIVTVGLAAHSVPTDFQLWLTYASNPTGMGIAGSDRSSGIAVGAGQLTIIGESIFVIPATTLESDLVTGINLTVRNIGANTIIGASAPATTQASLFVQKLSN